MLKYLQDQIPFALVIILDVPNFGLGEDNGVERKRSIAEKFQHLSKPVAAFEKNQRMPIVNHDQQVNVASLLRCAAGLRAEKDDLFGMKVLNDPVLDSGNQGGRDPLRSPVNSVEVEMDFSNGRHRK